MNAVIGIDLGSRTTKILTLSGGEIRHSEIFDTGHDPLPGSEGPWTSWGPLRSWPRDTAAICSGKRSEHRS